MMDQPGTPYLALDLDAFEANVARMAGTILGAGKRWRPHVKAIRSPVLARQLIAAGAHGVTCSSVTAASQMVAAGIGDVLIATEVVGETNWRQLAELNRQARVYCATDSLWHAGQVAAAGRAAGTTIPLLIEIEVGLRRAGVVAAEAPALFAGIETLDGVSAAGVMAWEGHTTTIADPADKARAVAAAVGLLTDAADRCRAAGYPVDIVSCGGTGTYPFSSRIDGVTEIQAGGGVFGDERYRTEFHIDLDTALTLVTTVLSRPTPTRIVCDAGWKATGCHPSQSRPVLPANPTRLAWSAEHLTIECSDPDEISPIRPGDRLTLRLGDADATVFLHRRLWTFRGGALCSCLPLPDNG
ncbi:MAG: alanine racemase [Lautropia sp.]